MLIYRFYLFIFNLIYYKYSYKAITWQNVDWITKVWRSESSEGFNTACIWKFGLDQISNLWHEILLSDGLLGEHYLLSFHKESSSVA